LTEICSTQHSFDIQAQKREEKKALMKTGKESENAVNRSTAEYDFQPKPDVLLQAIAIYQIQ
jgi:hypothetical protein